MSTEKPVLDVLPERPAPLPISPLLAVEDKPERSRFAELFWPTLVGLFQAHHQQPPKEDPVSRHSRLTLQSLPKSHDDVGEWHRLMWDEDLDE